MSILAFFYHFRCSSYKQFSEVNTSCRYTDGGERTRLVRRWITPSRPTLSVYLHPQAHSSLP